MRTANPHRVPLPEGWAELDHATRIAFAERSVEAAKAVIANWEMQIAREERALAMRGPTLEASAIAESRQWIARTRKGVDGMKRDLERRETLLAQVQEDAARDPQMALF